MEHPKELVFLEAAGSAGLSGSAALPCLTRLRAETRSFSGLAVFSSDELRIEIDGSSEQVMAQVASGNYFDLLGVRPALGRLMNAADEKLDPPVGIISDRDWRRRFGGDPGVIRYNHHWILERLRYRTATQARRDFLLNSDRHDSMTSTYPNSPVHPFQPKVTPVSDGRVFGFWVNHPGLAEKT